MSDVSLPAPAEAVIRKPQADEEAVPRTGNGHEHVPAEAVLLESRTDEEVVAGAGNGAEHVPAEAVLRKPQADEEAVAGTGADTEGVPQTAETKLLPLVVQIAEQRDLHFDSLLDIGCGMRPLDHWFTRFKRSEAPRRFIGIDPNAAAVEALVQRGQMAFTGFNARFDMTSDLVIAGDVLEYLTPSSAGSFVRKCASLTAKLFALSTVNAQHWSRTGVRREFGWIRWVPDSVYECFGQGDDFARIRNPMSADQVAGLMRAAFDPAKWDLVIYQAWPWEVRDLATDNAARFCLKTFAIAIAKGDRQ
jgi:hypothetical protein